MPPKGPGLIPGVIPPCMGLGVFIKTGVWDMPFESSSSSFIASGSTSSAMSPGLYLKFEI